MCHEDRQAHTQSKSHFPVWRTEHIIQTCPRWLPEKRKWVSLQYDDATDTHFLFVYFYSNPCSFWLVSTATHILTLSNFLIHFSNWAIQTRLSSTDSPRAYFETALDETPNMWSVNQHTHTPFMLKQLQSCSQRVNSTSSLVLALVLFLMPERLRARKMSYRFSIITKKNYIYIYIFVSSV